MVTIDLTISPHTPYRQEVSPDQSPHSSNNNMAQPTPPESPLPLPVILIDPPMLWDDPNHDLDNENNDRNDDVLEHQHGNIDADD